MYLLQNKPHEPSLGVLCGKSDSTQNAYFFKYITGVHRLAAGYHCNHLSSCVGVEIVFMSFSLYRFLI